MRNYTCRFVLICFPSNVFTIFRHDFLKENSPVELFFFIITNYGTKIVLRNEKNFKIFIFFKMS